MLSKLFCAFATLAGCAAADVSTRPNLNLSDLSSGANDRVIAWKPSLGGLSRNEFRLPARGIADAVKYGDTSALYYLTDKRDTGLNLGQREDASLQIQLGSEISSVSYTVPISAATDFTLVGEVGAQARLGVNLSYKFVGPKLNLNVITASLMEDKISTRIEGVKLSPGEQGENFWSIDTQSDGRHAIGRRWFGVARDFDTALTLGYADARAYLQGAVEFENNLGGNFFGIRATEQGSAEILFGISMKFEKSGRAFNRSTYDIYSPSGTLTLKFIADSQLPRFWQTSVIH
jgi:hypothetical protein